MTLDTPEPSAALPARDRMVRGAAQLIHRKGVSGTGMREIVSEIARRRDDGHAGAEVTERVPARARIDLLRRRHWYRAPSEKSWPHNETAVDSRAIQVSSSTVRPSQPNSTSKPPGVFM